VQTLSIESTPKHTQWRSVALAENTEDVSGKAWVRVFGMQLDWPFLDPLKSLMFLKSMAV
jgi:hypothetical protein